MDLAARQLQLYLIREELDMDVVLPEAVFHEQHFLAGHKVVLTHSDHFTVPERLRHLPA